MTRHLLPFVLLLAAATSSCALFRSARNEPLDPQKLDQLQPGVTTARRAVELLGGPTQVVQLGLRSAYRYEYEVTKGAGLILLLINFGHTDTRQDRVWLFFDENEMLTHFGSTLESHRAQYALPWEDIHETSDDEAADVDRFGPPTGPAAGPAAGAAAQEPGP